MTGAQRKDVDTLLGALYNFHPQNLKIQEKSKTSILISYQLQGEPGELVSWYWLGNWDGQEYKWQFQYDGMPEN